MSRRPSPVKEVLRLVDEEPVLDAELLVARPLDFRILLRAAGRSVSRHDPARAARSAKTKQYSLTDSGRDAARQFLLGARKTIRRLQILRMLETRPLSASLSAKESAERAEPAPVAGEEGLHRKSRISKPSAIRCARRPPGCVRRVSTAAPDGVKLTKRERELHAVPRTASRHAQSRRVGGLSERSQPGCAVAGAARN